MPRKKKVGLKREVMGDPKYNDRMLSQLINMLMMSGKKSVAEKAVYRMLNKLAELKKEDPLLVLKKGLENIKPSLEVRSRRVGGANYQIPVDVRPERRMSLGLRWFIEASRARHGKSLEDCLAAEVVEALENRGAAVKKREDVHKMAEANRAFAHYRW